MMPFLTMMFGGFSGLDQQVVTAGSTGSIGDRKRGFSTALAIGSIVDGTSNVYSGAAITELYHDETTNLVHLKITGAANSGWTTMRILSAGLGTVDLLRASGTFASNEWTWTQANPFGGAATVTTVQWYA